MRSAMRTASEEVETRVLDVRRASMPTRRPTRATYQAMEALIHNLNTMNSRAGAQVPFSSINYGMDTSPEGRMVMRNVLLATEAGPWQRRNAHLPHPDLPRQGGRQLQPRRSQLRPVQAGHAALSAKRLFPNFSFVDAPFNLQYYKEGHPETEIAYMGCRTRVIGNVYDPDPADLPTAAATSASPPSTCPASPSRPRATSTGSSKSWTARWTWCIDQLLERFEIQANKKVHNYPFLMGRGRVAGLRKAELDDEVREVLKHGTLSIGFIGLAEMPEGPASARTTAKPQTAQNLGLEIIGLHAQTLRRASARKTGSTLPCWPRPRKGLSGRFVRIDQQNTSASSPASPTANTTPTPSMCRYITPSAPYEKIRIEAPYHALTNAGHITYVELDGDPTKNLDAFEKVVRYMKDAGIGYGSINHPVDRDPVCGYNGIIGDTCPNCGRSETDGDRLSSASAASPAIWWARWTASTMPSVPRNATA